MATLILGTVGRIFGGPLGGIVGTALGGIVDRGLLGGGGKGREVGRIGNLAVQSAAYGEPIPFVAGRMRAAGNLLWTSGIAETATRSGGGKRSGPATTSYSYSASFAVGLAAREIAAIGRIWADGKLIRDAAGVFLAPVTMRLHTGSEAQAADPLIAAAEGAGGTPAYRGIAYAVFEDLPLADYGNRLPNLTFEIIADASGAGDVGAALGALAMIGGRRLLTIDGEFPAIAGHFSGRSGSLADALEPLLAMAGAALSATDGLVARGRGGGATAIPDADCQARAPGDNRAPERRQRQGGEALVGAVEIAFYDTSRDFQPGLQRARRDNSGGTDHQSIACAMNPEQAKTLATAILARAQAARLRATVRLPWRYLTIRPGDLVSLAGSDSVWRVRQARFEGFVVHLDLERVEATAPPSAASDGGRVLAFDNRPAGPTALQLLDLPPLPGEVPVAPRLWVAAAGASPAWRRAGIEISGDDGASYASLGIIEGGAVQGFAATRLPAGSVDAWDRFATVEVALLSDAMWLEGKPAATVLAGGNLALIGAEIIQFAAAEALAPGRFRLSNLLRGRRGSEATVGNHLVGERFVLLDQSGLLAFDPPLDGVGRGYRVRATGAGDSNASAVIGIAAGRALQPLSPAHLQLQSIDGAVLASWVRRSRAGFGWLDFVDAPLAEAFEVYRVDVLLDGRSVRSVTVPNARYVYSVADRLADGGGDAVTIVVAQLSAAVGPGGAAQATLRLT
jgi:hypothetical protein